MKPSAGKKDTATLRAVYRDEEGKKCVEKVEVNTHNVETIKYVERKLVEKGVQRMECHPSDGTGIGRPPPKSGHGGKYTWEGPRDAAEYELVPIPPAIDQNDPNYVDEEKDMEGEVEDEGIVIGKVEEPKVEESGVARIEVDPHLKVN